MAKSPPATAVTVKSGLPRIRYCSMREPSEVARNFCSLTQTIDELTNETPFAFIAVSLIFSSSAIFSSTGTSNGSRSKRLRHVALTALTGTSRTGLRW